ncbi:MAG: translocation/assembly module TamB domain-containing protein [Brevinema sp.]
MRKKINDFLSKTLFSFFFIYIVCLGIINIAIALNKHHLESFLAKKLLAQSVTLDNVSNMPLVFISLSDLKIVVDDQLSLSVEGIYFYYRFWKIFTKEFEQIIGDLRIEKIKVFGHTRNIKAYRMALEEEFGKKTPIQSRRQKPLTKQSDFEFKIERMDMDVDIRSIEFVVKMKTEFRNMLSINNTKIALKNDSLDFGAQLHLESVWSNCVFIASSSFQTRGSFTNFSQLEGDAFIDFTDVNFAGLPIVDQLVTLQLSVESNRVIPNFINRSNQKIAVDTAPDDFQFSLDKKFKIEYKDFEEYEMLDYAYAPGDWNFKLDLRQTDQWYLNASLKSHQHPNNGLELKIDPVDDNLYKLKLDLKTHYFGALKGDLFVRLKEGFYPMPNGTLNLDNVRFVLAGLVFSGNAVVNSVPGKNAICVTAFDVAMNGGHIGNTRAIFGFHTGYVTIKPAPIPNMAASVDAYLGKYIDVQIKALDVDGDFVYKNVKLPFFGLPTSRYIGDISITKDNADSPVQFNASVEGFLDGEKQIETELYGTDGIISIPHFRFISQDLTLNGDVRINSQRSNTIVQVDAFAQLHQNDPLPIDVRVNVQKKNALVDGIIDDIVQFKTESDPSGTSFSIDFEDYVLSKLGLAGKLDGGVDIEFDEEGWKNFSVKNAAWKLDDQAFRLSFDSERVSNLLEITNLQLGLNSELLKGEGYLNVSGNSAFAGAFNFHRGGSLSFATGSYTWKFKTDIYNYYIPDIRKIPFVKEIDIPEQFVSSVLMDLNLDVKGTWGNPQIQSRLALRSTGAAPYFQLVIPELVKKDQSLILTNLRLRTDLLNLDSDLAMDFGNEHLEANLSGAFAVQEFAKSRYSLSFYSSNDVQALQYQLSNLYIVSKKPMTLSGRVINSKDQYLLLSDHPRYGIAGSYIKNNRMWDIVFKSDSIEARSGGRFVRNNDVLANFTSKIALDKMSFSGDIRRVKGTVGVYSTIEGSLDNPRIDGKISSSNLSLQLASLKNRISIEDVVDIPISNNIVSFPDIKIEAGKENPFYLDGFLEFRDRGISEANLNLYSKKLLPNSKDSSLNWNVRFPYLNIRGKTLIDRFSLVGAGDGLTLETYITAENMNIGLELADSFANIGRSDEDIPAINPVAAMLSSLNLNVHVNVQQGFRFFNQLFDLTFEKNAGVVSLQGNIVDNTVVVSGNMDITKGKVNYLNTDLKVEGGALQFSQEYGDPFPTINLQTVTTKYSSRNEQVDIYVNFQGKLPNIELSSISSNPPLPNSQLLNILSGGTTDRATTRDNTAQSTGQVLASGVEVAENLLFTTPLSQRIQRLLPFIDMIEIKTDFLGNITRVLSDGGEVSGLSVLHGTEVSIAQFIPNLPNVQLRYDLRLESLDNTSVNSSTDLVQVHKAGVELAYPVNHWRLGLRPGIAGKVGDPKEQVPEFLVEGSAKFRW